MSDNSLDKFKQKMCQETQAVSGESKKEIDEMEIDGLYKKLDKNGVMTRVVMMSDADRKYAYGCMEVMHHLETVEEKYAACRFFYLLEIGSKQWPQLALFSKAFVERSSRTTKTVAY
jgi:hypothetical protein